MWNDTEPLELLLVPVHMLSLCPSSSLLSRPRAEWGRRSVVTSLTQHILPVVCLNLDQIWSPTGPVSSTGCTQQTRGLSSILTVR